MRIAIAGGTSPTLGTSIINAILSHGKHTPIILTRQTTSSSTIIPPNNPQIETRSVDYTSIPSLTTSLAGIDILISVLLIPGPEMVTYQINLLRAAEQAGVKRFAPSEFSLPVSSQDDIEFFKMKVQVWIQVQESVSRGIIDAARFPTGMWMNYLAIGCRYYQEEGLAGFREGSFLVHLEEKEKPWVEVPVLGDGGYPLISMTDLRDIGRFMVAAVEMEEPWGGRELGMVGETVSMPELVRLCKEFVGEVEVRGVTEGQLLDRLRDTPEEEYLKRMETEISLVGCRDGFVVKPTLNGLCDVQPITIRGFMERYWGGSH